MAFELQRASQPLVRANFQPHVMGLTDRIEIEVSTPDEGCHRLKKPRARVLIARADPRLDIGRTLPCPPDALIIALGGFHRETDRRYRRIGAQTQIGAKDIALGGQIGQRGHGAARRADEACPRLHLVDPVEPFLIEQADEVDVGRIIQLPGPVLAHGQREHTAAAFDIRLGLAGDLAPADLPRHMRP